MMLQEIQPFIFHIEYREQKPSKQDVLLCYQQDKVLLKQMGNGEISLPTMGEAGIIPEDVRYLFAVDNVKFFCPLWTSVEEFKQYHYEPVRSLRNAVPMWKAFAAATGFQLWSWYGKNQFCGRCGKIMIHSEKERAMCCSDCNNTVYPAIAPSVIVAVTNGNKLLLTRYQMSHSAYRNYALIAGYVETGETVEDTVRREVMEEVGLKVKNIRYYKSQPWSFSGALLLGFFCEVDGDDTICREEEELEEAIWMERGELPDRSKDISLTSEMMEQFRLNSCLRD